jgi:hypothetical protein
MPLYPKTVLPVDVKAGDVVLLQYDDADHCVYVVTISGVDSGGVYGAEFNAISNAKDLGSQRGGYWPWEQLRFCNIHSRS